jgi:hypothetical protein
MSDTETQDVVFYVSPDGKDRWSGRLRAANSERTDGPFRTLERAREAVRVEIADGMGGDVVVEVGEGVLCLSEPLTLTERDSGRDGHRVIYRGRRAEDAVLVAGLRVEEWQNAGDGTCSAQVPVSDRLRSIYENGCRSRPARLPDRGYFRAAGPVEGDPKRKFYFAETDVPRVADKAHLEVGIWPGGKSGEWNWFFDTARVRRIDHEKRIIELEEEVKYEIGPGSRYFLQGAGDFLTTPGQFHYDPETGILRYRPRSVPIEEQRIMIPVADAVITLHGSSADEPTRNITVEGLTVGVTRTGSGVVHLENAEGVSVRGCRVHNAGGCGVRFDGSVRGCTFAGNEISDVGYTGIYASGPGDTRDYVSRDNRMADNHIFGCGQIVRHGAGLQLNNSGDNEIVHNRIHHVPRYAISLKSHRPGVIVGTTIDGVEVTRQNAQQFAHSRNNLIAYNDLSHANLDSQDTGVIEAWGAGTGNVIRHNRVHHSNIYMSFGFGIYLDDACDEFLVARNIVDCLQEEGAGELSAPLLIKGVENRVIGNLVVRNDATAAMRFIEMAHEPNRRIHVESNVFCNTGENLYLIQNHDEEADWQEDRLEFSDRNLLHKEAGRYGVVGVAEAETFEQWRRLLGGKYDQNSQVADPRFVDEEGQDYRLRHDSPARELGFEEIDRRPIGLTAEFPFADPREELEAVFPAVDNRYTGAAELRSGEEAPLEVTARTRTGYVADLTEAEVVFRSADQSVATVNADGLIRADAPGTTLIEIRVQRGEQTITTRQEIVVR